MDDLKELKGNIENKNDVGLLSLLNELKFKHFALTCTIVVKAREVKRVKPSKKGFKLNI